MFILRTMVHELESLGYGVEEQVVDTSQYGVPQFRQRLILVALRGKTAFTWPPPVPDQVTVWNAISDLPSVEGGWRPEGGAGGWAPYAGPANGFQRRMREGIDDEFADRVYDQITRPVREDDKIAFQHMDAKTRYSEIPEHLRRYRADIFDDKYKRLNETACHVPSLRISRKTATGISTHATTEPSPSERPPGCRRSQTGTGSRAPRRLRSAR